VTADHFAPRARIDISGVTLAADVTRQLLSLRYEGDVELAHMATIVLDNTGNRFTDSPLFDLGKEVELYLGYGDDLRPMMLGNIASVEPSFPQSGAPTMTIVVYDKSYRLRHDVPERPAFQFMNDSLVATQIALEAGLIPVVDPSVFPPHTLLPRNAPDMAILKERAFENFFEVYVEWDKLYFRFPRPATEVPVLEWGRTLSSFDPRFSHADTPGVQIVRGYNEDLALDIVGVMTTAGLDLDSILERLGEAGVGALASLGRRVVRHHKVKSPLDAVLVAKAILQDLLEGMYEASGSCIGQPDLRAGSYVEIAGVGKRFSGRYRLSKVTHTFDQQGYRTDFAVNQRASSTVLGLVRKATQEDPPPDKRPPVEGVVVGTVRVVDPVQYKVAVSLPQLEETDLVIAHCATLSAGNGRGTYFLPEINDQVLLAFAGNDVSEAYVIGSLWSQIDVKPVLEPTAITRIRSRTGHTLTFDDVKSRLSIEHPTGASVSIEADGSVSVDAFRDVTLSAPLGTMKLAASKIELSSAGGIDLTTSSGEIALSSDTGGIGLTTPVGNVTVRATAVAVKVDTNMNVTKV
jgi:phage protein D/phage baseplate assembly protein gpV